MTDLTQTNDDLIKVTGVRDPPLGEASVDFIQGHRCARQSSCNDNAVTSSSGTNPSGSCVLLCLFCAAAAIHLSKSLFPRLISAETRLVSLRDGWEERRLSTLNSTAFWRLFGRGFRRRCCREEEISAWRAETDYYEVPQTESNAPGPRSTGRTRSRTQRRSEDGTRINGRKIAKWDGPRVFLSRMWSIETADRADRADRAA